MSLMGVAPSYTVLAVLLFVMGIASTLFHVPAPVMIKETSGDKIGRKNMMLIICTASPVLMWAFISSNSIFVFPLLFMLGFFLFATGPVMLAQLNDMKTDRPAFINGIYMTLNFSISAATIMLLGILGNLKGLKTTYMISAVVSLGSIPFVMRLPK